MSPYKKADRPTWYVWPTLPGFGRVGPWSTGTRNKGTAERIEAFLTECALTNPDVLTGLEERRYSLPELWAAHLANRTGQLMESANDPPLRDVARVFMGRTKDHRYQAGMLHLLRLAPQGARLSYVARPTDPRRPSEPSGPQHIRQMVQALLAEGLKPNSVLRSFVMGVSKMLTETLGRQARDLVFRDVELPHERDTRDIDVSAVELDRLLGECGADLYPIVAFALLTGWDLGPICRMQPRDFNEADDTMLARDTKTDVRGRRVQLSSTAASIVRAQSIGREPGGPLWDLNGKQVWRLFVAARGRAGLPTLRFKDLRHIAATAAASAGMNAREVQDYLRHATGKMALRYLSSLPNERRDKLDAQADVLGLGAGHLRKRGRA